MSELEKGFVGSNGEPVPAKAAYEPPRLRSVGTLAELIHGVAGASDGLGPGSALGDGGAVPPSGPGAP